MSMNKKKIVSLLILAAMALSGFATGCSNNSASTTADETTQNASNSEAPEVSSAEEAPVEVDLFENFRSVDLGGRTVNISVSSNVSEGGAGMPSSYLYIAGPAETVGESVQDNVYERNIFVEELLGCKLNYMAADLPLDQVQPYLEKLVTSGDTSIDYYVNDQYGLLNCALNGSLLDLTDQSLFKEYYFDFNTDAYYTEYMAGLTLGDKRFIMTGDYFIDTMRASHVLYFNKNIYTSVFGNADDLYNKILEKNWTMDEFNKTIDAAYIDVDGDGKQSDGDTYGLSIHSKNWGDPYYVFYYSTDCHAIDKDDDGVPYINALNVERMSKMAEKLIVTNTSNGTYKTENVGESLKKFVNGQSLFTAFQKIGDIEQSSIRDFDGMGVVPYPLMDETQTGYRTLVHDTAEMGALPITTIGEAATAASAVIQVMSIHAHENLLHDYYETALKSKYAQDEYTAKMLDLVVAGISAPFELAYEFGFSGSSYLGGITFLPVRDSIDKGTDVTASGFERRLKIATKKLDKLIEIYLVD